MQGVFGGNVRWRPYKGNVHYQPAPLSIKVTEKLPFIRGVARLLMPVSPSPLVGEGARLGAGINLFPEHFMAFSRLEDPFSAVDDLVSQRCPVKVTGKPST